MPVSIYNYLARIPLFFGVYPGLSSKIIEKT